MPPVEDQLLEDLHGLVEGRYYFKYNCRSSSFYKKLTTLTLLQTCLCMGLFTSVIYEISLSVQSRKDSSLEYERAGQDLKTLPPTPPIPAQYPPEVNPAVRTVKRPPKIRNPGLLEYFSTFRHKRPVVKEIQESKKEKLQSKQGNQRSIHELPWTLYGKRFLFIYCGMVCLWYLFFVVIAVFHLAKDVFFDYLIVLFKNKLILGLIRLRRIQPKTRTNRL